MIFIGIDPGVSGGIAMIDHHACALHTVSMPKTESDLLELLLEGFILGRVEGDTLRPCRAMLERVHSFPKQGHSGAFTFGRNYGALLMALTAARIPFDLVSPLVWQRALGCLSGGDKNVTKRRAQQLFPFAPVTHAIADALLLAEYARRGEPQFNATSTHRQEGQDGQATHKDGQDREGQDPRATLGAPDPRAVYSLYDPEAGGIGTVGLAPAADGAPRPRRPGDQAAGRRRRPLR